MKLPIKFSRDQHEYFFGDHGKYRIMTKGRRVGFTHGAANYCISHGLRHDHRILWGDTVQTNIDRYVERYFFPVLKKLPSDIWNWNAQKKEMRINESLIDFRSAERTENWEGFGYHRIILNEAGIILKGERGRYLWNNAVLPMSADYKDCIIYLGGTPKGRTDRDGSDCLYYQMASREGYYHLNIPTNKNPFLNQEVVAEVIAELPEGPIRDQEAYGKFVDAGSGIIKREWLKIDDMPIEGKKVIGVDLAVSEKTSADDTALVAMVKGERNRYQIVDAVHFKKTWPNAKDLIMGFIERHDAHAFIESNAQMLGLIDDLRRENRMQKYVINDVLTTRDKIACSAPWISRLESGQLTLLRGEWNNDFVLQAIAFTIADKGRTDDMLDATSRCWSALQGDEIGCA
jgi:predicted phage terminase large subunit-like protein